MSAPKVTDQSIERMISKLLLAGVLLSGAIVLTGGIYYVIRHASEQTDFHTFHGQPSIDRLAGEIVSGAIALRARSIIQLGILVLIATPILRVAVSLVGFALERDRKYVMVTMIVLAVLLYSLVNGAVAG
jgi:uncharacterized membrane protein